MAGMATINLIGNVGGDPETRFLPNGTQVANFSVAVTRQARSNQENQESTDWYRVSAFGRLAEIVQEYVTKGRQVYVSGRLSTRTYQASNGEPRFSLEVNASELQMLGGGRDDGEQTARDYAPAATSLDEIPF